MDKDTRAAGRQVGDAQVRLRRALEAAGATAGVVEAVAGIVGLAAACEGMTSALEIERAVIDGAIRAVRPLLREQIQLALDAADRSVAAGACPTRDRGRTHSIGRRTRRWISLAGPLRLTRKGLECSTCDTCDYPSQRALGLGEGDYTPRLEEAVSLLATTLPHAMAVKLAGELFPVQLSESGVQDMVERRARGVQTALEREAAEHPAFNAKGLPATLPAPPHERPRRIYVEIDGVLPMTREELADDELDAALRATKERAEREHARGGKGRKYRLVGREVKLAVIYEAQAAAQESDSRGCLLRRHYVAHLGEAKDFQRLLWAKLVTTGLVHAAEIVVVSDGADWIRRLVEGLPLPGRVRFILDLFHVKHRIWEVANALYGEHSLKAAEWAHSQCARVEAGHCDQVLEALRFLRPKGATRELRDALVTYLGNNLDRVDYPTYRAQGLRVGSGAIESSNYHVIGARLKLQGCRWSEAGAREMAYLRADLFNDLWRDRTRALLTARP